MANLPNVEKILERQAKSWEVRRKLAGEGGEAARDALAHLKEGPWLTVSRQIGCGGTALAGKLAERLDWQLYNREILQAIAAHTHSRERILSQLEQGVVAPFQEFIARLLVRDDPSQLGYLKELTHVVWGLAKKGNAVIVGRAANWFLDEKYGVRIRVVAPVDARVRRVAEQESCSADAARALITAHDAKRKAFIEEYFGRDINDPLGYDLIVNVGALDLDAAVEAVVTALRVKLGSSD